MEHNLYNFKQVDEILLILDADELKLFKENKILVRKDNFLHLIVIIILT